MKKKIKNNFWTKKDSEKNFIFNFDSSDTKKLYMKKFRKKIKEYVNS